MVPYSQVQRFRAVPVSDVLHLTPNIFNTNPAIIIHNLRLLNLNTIKTRSSYIANMNMYDGNFFCPADELQCMLYPSITFYCKRLHLSTFIIKTAKHKYVCTASYDKILQ
jgi:hypothetical protein